MQYLYKRQWPGDWSNDPNPAAENPRPACTLKVGCIGIYHRLHSKDTDTIAQEKHPTRQLPRCWERICRDSQANEGITDLQESGSGRIETTVTGHGRLSTPVSETLKHPHHHMGQQKETIKGIQLLQRQMAHYGYDPHARKKT
jgi:hypothetical protein